MIRDDKCVRESNVNLDVSPNLQSVRNLILPEHLMTMQFNSSREPTGAVNEHADKNNAGNHILHLNDKRCRKATEKVVEKKRDANHKFIHAIPHVERRPRPSRPDS